MCGAQTWRSQGNRERSSIPHGELGQAGRLVRFEETHAFLEHVRTAHELRTLFIVKFSPGHPFDLRLQILE
jgi:hypothetical protein